MHELLHFDIHSTGREQHCHCSASSTYIVLSTRGCSPWRPAAVVSTTRQENDRFPRIFKGRRKRTGPHNKCGALSEVKPYLRLNRLKGDSPLKRKDNSSRGSRRRLRVRLRYRCCHYAALFLFWFGNILTRFPFDRRTKIRHFLAEVPYLLGSTNPCSTAVHMEPFLHFISQSKQQNNTSTV